jgi:hypothetical protein
MRRPRRASAPLVHGDRYHIGDVIGRGGMGEVCSAYDSQIGREVAIKVMNTDHPGIEQLTRFLREARIQGRLQNPAIPPVHEIGVDETGRPYFVMARLAGVTLARVLRDRITYARFTRQHLLRAFVDVCHAIEVAHAGGIAHRDLKPSNVLLGDRGEVYVLDWGIARELDRPSDERGATLGTRGYMPPEQVRGDDDIDHRVDVYALGCLLSEILTGKPTSIREQSAPLDDVPPELEQVCRSATAMERDERLGSVRELCDVVQRYLDGDRDLERRRELAASHFANAQAALATQADDEERHRVVMREAGRAIALDPTFAGAAELVGRLMLSPPSTLPAVVAEELAVLDRETDRRHLRNVAALNVAQILMVPLLVLLGIHDVTYLVAFGGLGVVNLGAQIAAIRSARFFSARYTEMFGTLLAMAIFALLARMFTPFLCAPGFVAVGLMSVGLSSIARERKVIVKNALLSIVAVIGVWAAEAVGLLSRTTWVVGDTLVLRSPLEGIGRFPIIAAICVFVVMLIGTSAAIAHAVSSMHCRARKQLQIQSWQLRQLL